MRVDEDVGATGAERDIGRGLWRGPRGKKQKEKPHTQAITCFSLCVAIMTHKAFSPILNSEFGIQFRLRKINPNSIINMENYITFQFRFGIEFRFPIKTRNVPNVSEIIWNIWTSLRIARNSSMDKSTHKNITKKCKCDKWHVKRMHTNASMLSECVH